MKPGTSPPRTFPRVLAASCPPAHDVSLLQRLVALSIQSAFPQEKRFRARDIPFSLPPRPAAGEYATSVAFLLAQRIGRSPLSVAQDLHTVLQHRIGSARARGRWAMIQNVSVAGSGFLNFFLSPPFLFDQIRDIFPSPPSPSLLSWRHPAPFLLGKKIMVEFAHPNTHKEFHIGHLRNIAIGESLCRILAACGAEIFRANYEGDVGLHVAKAIWGIYRILRIPLFTSDHRDAAFCRNALATATRSMTPRDHAKFLGEGYARGSKAYEDDAGAKTDIIRLNTEIYKHPAAVPLWKETREMSLNYFDTVYRRLGTHFDRLFFESEVEAPGRQLVIDGVKTGIFLQDADGSIFFPGERYGLNSCVFVTKEQYATYEGKDVALEHLEYQTFPYDLDIHVVANEQINFFQLAFKALELLFPYQKNLQFHLAYGMVSMPSGKISSRTGDVVTADSLIDHAKARILHILSGERKTGASIPVSARDSIAETLAVSCVKYAMLRVNPKQDISFDLARSLSFDGDSGAYLLYTYTRCMSVLRQVKRPVRPFPSAHLRSLPLHSEERHLLFSLSRFSHAVGDAAVTLSPSTLCSYLFQLCQTFNTFYMTHSILHPKDHDHPQRLSFRLFLVDRTALSVSVGLSLLGIGTVERM